jgi:hypothetical protein
MIYIGTNKEVLDAELEAIG